MSPDTKQTLKGRLARIEGQVRGLGQMVEQDRYCIDVVTQVRAARAALAKVEQIVLADHLGSCVEAAIVSGDPKAQRAKVAELIDVLGRSDR
jgi:DNA-binding FrmR family transcriptional regulator